MTTTNVVEPWLTSSLHNYHCRTKRKDGLWQASMTIGRDPFTGKLKRVFFYAKTCKGAADKLSHALHDKSRGGFVAPHKRTFGEWLDTWLWEYKKPRLRPITFDSYEMLVRRHLKPVLGTCHYRTSSQTIFSEFTTTWSRQAFQRGRCGIVIRSLMELSRRLSGTN
jgi:integrase